MTITIQQVIDKLMKVEDKSKEFYIFDNNYCDDASITKMELDSQGDFCIEIY